MITLDLRTRDTSCTEHPIVKLNIQLREAKLKRSDLKIIIDPEETPLKAIKLSLKKHGYEIRKVIENKNHLEIEAVLKSK